MEIHERQLMLDQLASSEARLLDLVEGLTQEQWNFRETTQRWSIAEIIEHVILFENFVTHAIAETMDSPAEPQKKALAAAKNPLVHGLANSQHTKFNAREAVRPMGQGSDCIELIQKLRAIRARTIAFARETQADLRSHFFPHIAFGDLDCYQWLVVLGQHAERHALQIEEIKAHRAYPGR